MNDPVSNHLPCKAKSRAYFMWAELCCCIGTDSSPSKKKEVEGSEYREKESEEFDEESNQSFEKRKPRAKAEVSFTN